MPFPPVGARPARLSAWSRLLAWARRARDSRRGSIAVIVAVSFIPLSIAGGVAVDMSRMADARSALQRATDNAALSGAAAYVVYTEQDSFNVTARTMAHSAFCNAVTALPAGFSLASTSGSTACGSGQGPAVSAVIAGYKPGTRGIAGSSGCSATNSVVSGYTCGFIVTVSTSATVKSVFPFISGGLLTVSVTSSAINPFINLAKAITPSFTGAAGNANSLWVYPLLLDVNGAPDFTTNKGALPDASACTGNPTQTSCGSYTMLASTHYYNGCPWPIGCNVNGTVFINGIVQNPVVGTAVITATTPLGIALQSAAGVDYQPGYYKDFYSSPKPDDSGCSWSKTMVYNTVNQEFDAYGYPLEVDSSGHWSLVTHWMYSSFLATGNPPDYNEISLQMATNSSTGLSNGNQIIPAVPYMSYYVGYNQYAYQAPVVCPSPYSASNPANTRQMVTSYPTSGATNCALYIVKDPTSLQPDPSYANTSHYSPTCFTPSSTPGYQYAALSCQNYAGHKYAFFWNDMSGDNGANPKQNIPPSDDTDYGNGTIVVACSGASYVLLIN